MIPFVTTDALGQSWYDSTVYKDGRNIGVYRYASLFNKLHGKLIDKDGISTIGNEVKKRKFINHIPQAIHNYMPSYLHDEMRFPDIIKMAEEYEVANKGIESKA